MIAGKIVLQGFRYTVADLNLPDGIERKLLCFKDGPNGPEIHFVFTKDELSKFIQEISMGTIVVAHKLPDQLIIP